MTGYRLTEDVTTDNGCGPGTVDTGVDCPIELNCADLYLLCLDADSLPEGGVGKFTRSGSGLPDLGRAAALWLKLELSLSFLRRRAESAQVPLHARKGHDR